MASSICQRQNASTVLLQSKSATLSNAGDNTIVRSHNTNLEDGVEINPNPAFVPVTTTSVKDLWAIN